MSDQSNSIHLLTNMIQNLEKDVSEINITTKETNQKVNDLVTGYSLHDKRITDLEKVNETKKADNRWSFGAVVSIISLTLVVVIFILNYFITKSL